MGSPSPRSVVLVVALAAALYLLGNGRASLWDRDEPRYAQASRQMLEGGDWVVPRYLDRVRTAKPVFIYWCQAASMSLLGRHGDAGAFAARLPSAVAMVGVLALVAVAAWRSAGRAHAFWATLVLATSGLVVWSAKACTTDAVLLAGVTVAQLCLYHCWRGRATWPVVIVMALAIGQAGLTKGPVVLGVMGMTLAALGAFRAVEAWLARRRARAEGFEPVPAGEARVEDREPIPAREARADAPEPALASEAPSTRSLPAEPDRPPEVEAPPGSFDPPLPPTAPGANRSMRAAVSAALKILVAIALIAAVVGPWLYLVARREASFLGTSVGHDVFTRVVRPLEGHRGPPGYHLALIFATFLPWSALLPMAVVSAWQNRADPRLRFALAAVLGPWVMFEVVQTKLPHYMLPAFPPLAFLTADAVVRCLRGEKDDLRRRAFVVAAGVVGAAVVALAVGAWALAAKFDEPPEADALLLLAALAFAVAVTAAFARGHPAAGLLATGLGMAAVYAVLFGVYLPRADALRLSTRVADILGEHRTGERGPGAAAGGVVMLDYKEPSLAFYEGGTIREHSATALSHPLLDAAPPWLVITDAVWDKTPADVRARVEVVDSARGLAYADGGRDVRVMVVRRR